MNCSRPGSSVHGILQARIIEWVAIPFSRASSPPRDWTQVSCVAGSFFTIWATREAQCSLRGPQHLQCYPSLCLLFITEFKYFWKRREEGLRTLQIPQTQLQYEGSLAISIFSFLQFFIFSFRGKMLGFSTWLFACKFAIFPSSLERESNWLSFSRWFYLTYPYWSFPFASGL